MPPTKRSPALPKTATRKTETDSLNNRTLLHPAPLRPETLRPQCRSDPRPYRHRRPDQTTQDLGREPAARCRHWIDRRLRCRLGKEQGSGRDRGVWACGNVRRLAAEVGDLDGERERGRERRGGIEGEQGWC
jgi:hypothetical protein